MDEPIVLENDLRKLHAEINQIVSQRFQLTTVAILVFAAVCGWATGSVTRPGGLSVELLSLITLLLVAVLVGIFAYFMFLLGMMRIYTVYLEETGGSRWEIDWQEYRHESASKDYWGYSKAATVVFMLLGPLAFVFLAFLSWLTGGFQWRPLLWLPAVAVILYVALVGGAGWARHLLINEESIRRNWRSAIARSIEKRAQNQK